MAEFTQQLSGSVPTTPVINTAKQSPNVMGALSNLASGAVSVFENKRAREAEAAAQAKEAREEAVSDELTRSVLETYLGKGGTAEPEGTGQGPIKLYPPLDVANTAQGRRLGQITAAAQQGAIDYRRVDVEVKGIVRNLLNEFPDQATEIHAQLKEMGVMGAITREYDLQVSQAEHERKLIEEREKKYYETATNLGIPLDGKTQEEIFEIGREALLAAEEHAETVRKIDLESKQQNLANQRRSAEIRDIEFDRKTDAYNRGQNTRKYVESHRNRLSVYVREGVKTLTQLNTQAIETQNPEDIKKARDFAAKLSQDIALSRMMYTEEVGRMSGIDQSAAIASGDAYYNSLNAVVTNISTGDLSASSILGDTVTDITTSNQVRAQEMFPLLNWYTTAFSKEAGAIFFQSIINSDVFGAAQENIASEVAAFGVRLETTLATTEIPKHYSEEDRESQAKVLAGTRVRIEDMSGQDPEVLDQYASIVQTLSKEVGLAGSLTGDEAKDVINSSVHLKGIKTLKTLRSVDPDLAYETEKEVSKAVGQSMRALIESQGVLLTDPTAAEEGEIDWGASTLQSMAMARAGTMAMPVQPTEKSGIRFNEGTGQFETYGPAGRGERDRAQTLNRGLNYLFDYHKTYTPDTREGVINTFVYGGRRPNQEEDSE